MNNPYILSRRFRTSVAVLLLEAIDAGVQADIIWRREPPRAHYDAREEVRRVTVSEVDLTPPSDRVLCWDHVRKGYRTFKLDDIKGVGLTSEPARPAPIE